MIKNYSILALAILSLATCQPKKQERETQTDTTSVATPTAPPAVELTEQQKAEGWKLLFDGQTLKGWRFFKNKPNDSWEVADGVLHCKPFKDEKENQRADIMTTDEYENFELAFDWKISPQGNSGVMFRVTEENDQPFLSGPEFQIMDDVGYPGESKDSHQTGSNYDMHVATNRKINPVGEWNTAKLVVNGNHVEHWLNGSKVLEYELGSADWKKRKAASKWIDAANYGAAKKGHIDFQDHDHEAWYRNIMIKVL